MCDDNFRVIAVAPAAVPPFNPHVKNASYSEFERIRSVVNGNTSDCRSEFCVIVGQLSLKVLLISCLTWMLIVCFPVTLYRMGRYVLGQKQVD